MATTLIVIGPGPTVRHVPRLAGYRDRTRVPISSHADSVAPFSLSVWQASNLPVDARFGRSSRLHGYGTDAMRVGDSHERDSMHRYRHSLGDADGSITQSRRCRFWCTDAFRSRAIRAHIIDSIVSLPGAHYND